MKAYTETNTTYVIGIVVATLILVAGFAFINNRMNGGSTSGIDLSNFAMCLKDKGATFYGAYWCPHCAAQKKLFGYSSKLLPYHECSNPDGQTQNASCNAVPIGHYPTWIFADGTKLEGTQNLKTLATHSGCTLPAGAEGIQSPDAADSSSSSSSSVGTSTTTTSETATTSKH